MTLFSPAVYEPVGLRHGIYQGHIYQLHATEASSQLVLDALSVLAEELGQGVDPRKAHLHFSDAELFDRVGRARKRIYSDAPFRQAIVSVIAAWGIDPGSVVIDPIKLRAVVHDGHNNPLAAPVYYGHRDTWYAHPQSLINWWIPLHDLTFQETFAFYPDRFERPVNNDSESYDYSTWCGSNAHLKIGWQKNNAGISAPYPRATGGDDTGPMESFSCKRGQQILFSGSHFHQTLAQSLGTVRYSLDFRMVHLDDHHAGLGAPNVDNRSTGTALSDYMQPGSKMAVPS